MNWQKKIEEDGFAIVPVGLAREHLEKLLEDISHASPRRSRAGVRHALGLAPVAALAHEPRLIGLAHEVL